MININELRAHMARKGITQQELCRQINMNPATFYRKVNGKSVFTVLEVENIAEALAIPQTEWQGIFFATCIA